MKLENYKGGGKLQKKTLTTNKGDNFTRREHKRQSAEDQGRLMGYAEQKQKSVSFDVFAKRGHVKKGKQFSTAASKRPSRSYKFNKLSPKQVPRKLPRYHTNA